jgi:hypothetical protein
MTLCGRCRDTGAMLGCWVCAEMKTRVPAPQPPADAAACEDCEFDASFRCLVCSEKFCGKHAGKHMHMAEGAAR